MIKYKCTSPINKDACHIYKDQRCCVGCKHKEENPCRCSETKYKCEYKSNYKFDFKLTF